MIVVEAPASSANLGPGLDTLAIALNLWNRFEVEPATTWHVDLEGPEAAPLSGDDDPFRRAAESLAARHHQHLPPLRVRVACQIPMSRGLGSSASAVAAGLLAAERLLGTTTPLPDLVSLGARVEGHPDNVAAALLGGLVLCWEEEGAYRTAGLPWPGDLVAVVAWPGTHLPTKTARGILPLTVSRDDAVFNAGRAALLAAALTLGRLDWLPAASEDRLHQPYRAPLVPLWDELTESARASGAWSATLSGAGPAVLALTSRDHARPVAAALTATLQAGGVSGRSVVLEVTKSGARVTDA